jgi:hypothetical protein
LEKQTCSWYDVEFKKSQPVPTECRISEASSLGIENELEPLNPSSVTVEGVWCEPGKLPLGMLSQEWAELSSRLSLLLRVVRAHDREGCRNFVLTDLGTTFSDTDIALCMGPLIALLAL